MFCAGDEFMNTQKGNNNPYNQDNEITWLDWELLAHNQDIFRFFKHMIAFRKAHPSISRSRYWRDDIRWYGAAGEPDLSHDSQCLAFLLAGANHNDADIYVMINGTSKAVTFVIQQGKDGNWKRVVDTSLPSPADICEPDAEMKGGGSQYILSARSIVVLIR